MADGKISRELKHYLDGSFDTISYLYDSQGHLIEKVTTDEEGVVESRTVFEYMDSRLSAEKEMDDLGDVVSEKKYLFDDNGHLAEFTEWDRENNRHIRTVDEYNEQGLRVRSSRYIDGKLRERIGYTQDEKGRVTRMTEENERGGSTYQFEYDDSGNVLLQEETDGQGIVISKMERTYDALGRIQENRVFIDGQGRRMSQYYKVEYVYELVEQAAE
jgi:YD repeat-containing protein